MWHSELEIAIIEKDTQKISDLINSLPHFETVDEMKQAHCLMAEAADLIDAMRDEALLTMKHLKKHIDFLRSTQDPHENRFDILL